MVLAEAGESFDPTVVPAPAAKPAVAAKLSPFQRMKKIESILAEIRPQLQRDHGDVELIDVDGKNIYVKMTGACSGCQMASATLDGIQTRLVEGLGEFVKVVPASAAQLAMGA